MSRRLSSKEKVMTVLEGQRAGVSRDELAATLGYKDWRGLDVFMRRQGYVYRNNSYALPEEKGEFQPEPFVPQSVRIVLRAIEAGETDFTVIANKAGFRDRSELATYMKAQGWNWSSTERTYIKEGISDEEGPAEIEPTEEVTDQENGLSISADIDIRRFLPLLEYLEENLDRLETILQTYDSKNIPHYNFRGGITITKSVSMSKHSRSAYTRLLC